MRPLASRPAAASHVERGVDDLGGTDAVGEDQSPAGASGVAPRVNAVLYHAFFVCSRLPRDGSVRRTYARRRAP